VTQGIFCIKIFLEIKMDEYYKVRSTANPESNEMWNTFFHGIEDYNPPVDSSTVNYPLVKEYTQYYDEAINARLRGNNLSLTSYEIVRDIFQALDETDPYPDTLFLFRGVKSTPEFPVDTYIIGQEIQDPGFMSKTPIHSEATEFARGKCCLFIIIYPPGSKHLNLATMSFFGDENEYLTYPGEKFIIHDILNLYTEEDPNYILMKAYVLNYVGSMYNNIEDIAEKINYNIDEQWPSFLDCISPHLNSPLFFEDANIWVGSHTRRLIDRIYVLYAIGYTKNIYSMESGTLIKVECC